LPIPEELNLCYDSRAIPTDADIHPTLNDAYATAATEIAEELSYVVN
jgi:hypothetical protein